MKLKRERIPIVAIGIGLVVSSAITVPIALHYQSNTTLSNSVTEMSTLKNVNDLLVKSREALATKTAWLVRNGLDLTSLSPEDAARNQVSAYNTKLSEQSQVLQAIVENTISTPIYDNQGFSSQDINDAYGYVVALNKELGLPVVDWADEVNERPNDVYDRAYNTYTQKGYTSAQAATVANIMSKSYQDAAIVDSKIYGDAFEINYDNINNIKSRNVDRYLKNADQVDYESARLVVVLSKFQTMLGHDLTFKEGANLSFIVGKIKGYAPNAPYDVGKEIEQEDVQKLFNLRIDQSYSQSYSSNDVPSIDYTATSSSATFDQSLSIYKDISFTDGWKNNVNGVIWSPGEPVPGYQLHVKLTQLDNTTDSTICNVTFQLGVSLNQDPKVYWGSKDGQIILKQDIPIPVETLAYKQYIAQNTYYSGIDNYDFGSLDVLNGRINTDIAHRPYLDDVVARFSDCITTDVYGNRVYDFKNHNVTLDASDLTGIPLNSFSTPDGQTLTAYGNLLHTHQQLRFVVTDIDTNTGTSGLVGYFGVIDNQKATDDSDFIEVIKKLPCKLNGQTSNTVKIGFDLSPGAYKWIDFGTRVSHSVKSLLTVASALESHWSNYTGLVNTLDTAISNKELAIAFKALSACAAIAAIAVDAITFNFTAVVMDGLVIAIDAATLVMEGMLLNRELSIKNDALNVEKNTGPAAGFDPTTKQFNPQSSLKNLEVTWDDWNSGTAKMTSGKFVEFINSADQFMSNPRGVIPNKIKCAQQIQEVLSTNQFQSKTIFVWLKDWVIASYNDFRTNRGYNSLSANDINNITNEFTNITPTEADETDNRAVNATVLMNASSSLSAYAILNAFQFVSQEGDQSDSRVKKFDNLIKSLQQELNMPLGETNTSSIQIPPNLYLIGHIIWFSRSLVSDILDLKEILDGIQSFTQKAMAVSTLLKILQTVLDIVSFVCNQCADAALNWEPK